MPCHFLHTIHEELQWLPRGNIEDAWHGIINGALFHELEESTARSIHDQWLELVYEVGWADRQKCKMDGQLDRMKKRDEAGHTHSFVISLTPGNMIAKRWIRLFRGKRC